MIILWNLYIVLYRTPLILAKEKNYSEIVEILINDPRTNKSPIKISIIIFNYIPNKSSNFILNQHLITLQ